jgi:hypothetical protein
MSPEQILTREAFNQPARTPVSPDEYKDSELQILSKTLRELVRKDATEALQTVQIRTVNGGPAGIYT